MKKEIIEKELEQLGKKYSLPIKELDKELELTNILLKMREMPEFPMRIIRRRLVDIHILWINYLHSFIFPSSQSIVMAKEADGFNEKEKDDMYRTIAKLAKVTRESIMFEMKRDEAKEAEFVKQAFDAFKKIKKQIELFADKNIEFWKREAEKKDNG